MSETLAVTICDACGLSDTDPMIHVAYAIWKKDERVSITEPSFHFDCLPQEFRSQLQEDPAAHAVTLAAIDAAETGTKGDALREFIQAQPDDNNLDAAPASTDTTTGA